MRRSVLCAALTIVLSVSGCTERVDGQAVSVFADPFKVAGMPATDGPTGLRENPHPPPRTVEGTDHGQIDLIGAQSVSDIEQYWEYAFADLTTGTFSPVGTVYSWDARQYAGQFCTSDTYGLVNAGFCRVDDSIGWDRGVLFPALRKTYGDMAITMVLAHEYGHAVQKQAQLVGRSTPVLVAEQQADCLSGAYMRWVAEDRSPRFTLSTGDGLNDLLLTMISFRDPLLSEADVAAGGTGDEHGSAFERISAFQFGFTDGPSVCASIDAQEIKARRGNLPHELQQNQTGNWPVTEESIRAVFDAMTILFPLDKPPTMSTQASDAATCSDARPSSPASFCPATNTIYVDVPGMQKLGTRADDVSTLSGDNTAYSVLMSRYLLALQQQQGLSLDRAETALRTACLTGVATAKLAPGVDTPGGHTLKLAAGDLDEAVAGLLANGLVASDTNGDTIAAGFSRIAAFRAGALGDQGLCLRRYQ
ncbi:MAG: peptidase [Mycolicibacterium insubricum]